MRSQAQIDASRRNGAKSKGPITAQGKRHSRRNALKHGLLASSALLAEESDRAFHDIFESTRDAVEPANAIEDRLVEMLAAAFWKLSRAHSLLKVGLDRAIATEPANLPAPVRAVLILGSSHPAATDWLRLEKLAARAEASIHRNLARLTALWTSRTFAADPIHVALAASPPSRGRTRRRCISESIHRSSFILTGTKARRRTSSRTSRVGGTSECRFLTTTG